MKIISSIKDDGWHALGDTSYEWWYFDAIDTNGNGIVITFFYGLPFSPYYNRAITDHLAASDNSVSADPGNHSAFYFCLYGARRTECYALNEYPRARFQAARDLPEVSIDRSQLRYDPSIGFIITIDAPARFGKKVSGELIFKPEFTTEINGNHQGNGNSDGLANSAAHDHVWNCVAPRCRVDGEINITGMINRRSLKFHGSGYHDHNYGVRPMHIDMVRWHWGRLHASQQTSIYYIIENRSGARESLLAIIDNFGRLKYCGPAEYQAKDKRHFMGVSYYPTIDLQAKDERVRLSVTNRRIVDQGPFYLRFLAEQELLSGDGGHRALGFAEAFEPEKLFIKAYWPFVKMRIRKM